MLKLYRTELIDDGYISSSSTESTTTESPEDTAEAYSLARRAIESIPSSTPSHVSSNPIIALDFTQPKPSQTTSLSLAGYFTLFKYAASITTLATLQGLSTDSLLSSSPLLDQDHGITQTMHAYDRRAPGESKLKNEYTREEMVFIYKIFLIMGGLLLVLNSLIKLINTRVTGKQNKNIIPHMSPTLYHTWYVDIYGRIIICSRIVNAAVLWCLCALPFSGLHPLILIGVTMGSLVFQGEIGIALLIHDT
ncbi:predicted protein [Lichtheimia corymbifera JMRC:FSU:9682]|uniref:Uncharacterized protein n=1 Tax=Lichtheimia corymbifera JMRC:FSU:9682 TaxID=1263082 RepID=A0A068RXB3_9FUNG|nr:predicted protein [Lichtheimia corymbifera JMRC:FSU:9682]